MSFARFSFVVLLWAAFTPVHAQTTFGSITGTVTDATGAVVPNAAVTATNVATNIQTTTRTNEAGSYTIPQLNEGTYNIKASATGFQDFTADNIVLSARQTRRLDITFVVSGQSTTIDVAAGAMLIETETAHLSDSKTDLQFKDLPLNTRAVWAFLALSPTVQQQPGSSVVRFGGSRVNQENWAIDGTTFSDGVDNTQTGPLGNYIEWVQEAKVDLSNNSAEYGSIGQVTMVSKSGTNSFHGSLFDYYSTPEFRARDPFSPTRSTGIFHQPGGSIGGPVWIPKLYNGKDRTFFFFSYETSRGSQRTQLLNPTVPLAAWRTGNFSNLLPGTVIYDPSNGQPFAGNIIPSNRINQVSQKLQDMFYPTPNAGDLNTLHSQNYVQAVSRPYDPSTYWTTRIDHHIGDKDALFGRFTWSRLYNRPYEDNLPTIGLQNQVRNDRAATVSYTHTFGPSMINEIRWGLGYNNNPVIGPVNGPQIVQTLGLTGLAPNLPDIAGMPTINWSGIGLQRLTEPAYTNPGYRTHTEEAQELFSWFRGKHSMRFGVNMLRAEWDEYSASASLFGNLTFSNRFTSGGQAGQGNPYADFLLGIPTTAQRAFPPIPIYRNRWSFDFFAQDEYKVGSRLTLNYGVRWEPHFPWHENSGYMSIFDVGSGQVVVPDKALNKISPIFPQSYVGVASASSVGLPGDTLIRMQWNKIAPRVGVAFRPTGSNNTVIRAGWGIFYDVVPFAYSLGFGGPPFILNEPAYTNPTANPIVLPQVFPAAGSGGPSTVALPAAQNPDFSRAYSMQYNFTIERQQWNTGFRASYIGTTGRGQAWQYNYNSPVPNALPYIDKTRPFPNYPDIYYVTGGALHNYNGLTLEMMRHMSGGLYMQASWTWARDIYDEDYNWDLDPSFYTAENPNNRARDRGPSQDIPTHRFTANAIYELPFGRGKHWLSHTNRAAEMIAGGWQFTTIFSWQTGQFLTPLWTGPDPVGIYYTNSIDPAEVTMRPNLIANPNLPSGQRNPSRWFNTAAFTAPALGTFGSAGRGTIVGPGINVWHMGLIKYFNFSERARLRYEVTATNIFNHPNWGYPGTNLSDPTGFGVITSAGDVNGGSIGDQPGARSFRMGLRLEF